MPNDASEHARVNYDDLELDDELALLNDVPFTGIVFSLRSDGSLESESNYRDGLPDGLQEEWHRGGHIARRALAIRGNGSSEAWSWYPDGTMRTYRRFVDRRTVESRAWDQAGEPVDPETIPADNVSR